MKDSKITTATITTVGLFTAVVSVLSILAIPLPTGVPVTLQTFAMALCGYVLGWKKGSISVGLYIFLGTIGIPIFSGMNSGPGVLFGLAGGFIWGFLAMVVLCGASLKVKNKIIRIGCGILGLAICHFCGMLQFAFLSDCSLLRAFVLVSLPYILKDVLSVAGAYVAAIAIRKALLSARLIDCQG